jgi:hypothetical protein
MRILIMPKRAMLLLVLIGVFSTAGQPESDPRRKQVEE